MALKNMANSLTLYGHTHPSVFFTDNMSDKAFLERCFPSLKQGVVPIEKYGELETLEIPPPPIIEILPKDTSQSIDDAARLILNDVPEDQGCIVVGFDTEWNVELSPHGYVTSRGKTAIVQIAYERQIYVFQVRFYFLNQCSCFSHIIYRSVNSSLKAVCPTNSNFSLPIHVFSKWGVW